MSAPAPSLAALRIEVPLGSRVLLMSGLELNSEATESSISAVGHLCGELDRWQGTGTVIIAGGLFADGVGCDEVSAALAAHTSLSTSIRSYLEAPGRRAIFTPSDAESSRLDAEAISAIEAVGLSVTGDVTLECVAASGRRSVLVSADGGCTSAIAELADDQRRPWLEGIDRLDDPRAARRFTSSRALYRRLGRYLWVPALVAVVAAIATHLTFVSSRLSRLGGHHRAHHVFARVANAPWHTRLAVTAVVVIVAELLVGIAAALMARRAFRATAEGDIERPGRGVVSADADAAVGADQSEMDQARAHIAGGGAGLILGGTTAAGLTHLDTGFFTMVGASSVVIREHRGRLGLPPVFLAHRQTSTLELETGAELHLRLLLRDERLACSSRIERLAAGELAKDSPLPEQGLRLVASWPGGGTWPPPPDLSGVQARARRMRRIAAFSIFVTGLLDLLVAVSPPLRARLHTVMTYLPLGISQTAAAAVAITGIALVMLSRGVLRGQRRAWLVAVLLLGASMVLHVAHAGSVGATIVTGGVLLLLLVERRWFTGTTDRSSLASALPILAAVILVAVGAAFMGVELSNLERGTLPGWPLVLLAVSERLVGLSTVALPDHIDDFVYPTMLTVGVAVIVTLLYLATRPVVDRRLSEHHLAAERRVAERRARDIVRRHGRGTLDFFALRDDKQYFFYGDSLVAYAVYGGICLVSPDPIGPATERVQVWAAFRAFCDAHGWGAALIGAGEEWLPIYDEAGMRWLHLGDEAVVEVQSFSLEGGKMKGLRQANTRLARHGYSVEFLDPAQIDPARVPGLIALMSLKRRGDQERGFSMMLGRLFDPKDTGLLLTVVSGPDGQPAAMCQFVPSPAINGFSLDLMRRDPGEHPNGLLDFALCQTIEHLRAEGASGLSLNFAAFRSILDGEKGDSVAIRVERWGLKRLSSILPIETLWRFNEKYNPTWLARYLVYSSPEQFIPTVAAALRAESITEIPVLGRLLAHDPANRPGTVVPPELLEGLPISDRQDSPA